MDRDNNGYKATAEPLALAPMHTSILAAANNPLFFDADYFRFFLVDNPLEFVE